MKIFKVIGNMFKVAKYAFRNPKKYSVIEEAIDGYWFDYGYLYNIELAKLKEMRDTFKEKGMSADNDKYVRQMTLAIKLLEIIIDEGGFHFEWPSGVEPVTVKELRKNLPTYVCDIKVNTKNVDRFAINEQEKDFYVNRYPHELYLKKARYLYHKLRYEFEQYWWD